MKGGPEAPFLTICTGSITAKIGGSFKAIIDSRQDDAVKGGRAPLGEAGDARVLPYNAYR